MKSSLHVVVLASFAGACSSSSPAAVTPTEDAGVTADAAPGDPSVLAGTFKLTLQGASTTTAASTSMLGKVYDGATPADTIWATQTASGPCKLLLPHVPFCETPCGSSKACVADNTCQAYPTSRSVGTVRVRGVKTQDGTADFSMSPVANNYQPPAGTALAFPPFSEGDAVTLDAAGAYYPAFTLTGKGIKPLELAAETWKLTSGTAFTVQWSAATAALATVHVKLDVSHHGGSKGKIECDGPDAGSLEIAEPLVTQLLALGVAGYPSIIVSRESVSSVVGPPGRIELAVASVVEKPVEITGLTSCTKNEDCDGGKTCQSDLTCK